MVEGLLNKLRLTRFTGLRRGQGDSSFGREGAAGSPPAKHVVIFGGTSDIGGEVAQLLAADNMVTLVARRVEALEPIAAQLTAAGACAVHRIYFDADDVAAHKDLVAEISKIAPIDIAVIAFGILGDQAETEASGQAAARIIHTDFTAHASLATELIPALEQSPAKDPVLMAFSSIAGARVRRPNYTYGSAKAGLDGFLQGMQDRLHLAKSKVRLMIVRPGFVIGSMTEGMDPAPMSSTPDQVAAAAVAAMHAGQEAVWIPARLVWLARATKVMPRWVWRRMPR